MASEAVNKVLAKLPDARRSGSNWQARCPAHDDRNPSLSIAEGDDGRALVKCHAGCTTENIAGVLGLRMSDLMPVSVAKSGGARSAGNSANDSANVFPNAEAAIEALERKLGTHSAKWTYHDAEGKPVGIVVRWDKPDGKDIRPVSRSPEKDGWIIGGMPEPRPLYRLPKVIAADGKVYVCEGEKAAEAARALGLVATTSPHGSKSARKADWSPLAGKQVVILPDRDEAGEHYADDVIAMLAQLTPRPTVRVVRLPGLPAHGDMADFVEHHGGNVETMKKETEALTEQGEPIDLTEQNEPGQVGAAQQAIEPFKAFPIGALPDPVGSYVRAAAKALG